MNKDNYHTYLFDILPVAVAIVVDGKLVKLNPAVVQLLEASDEQLLLGKSVDEFVHPIDQPRSQGRLKKQGGHWANANSKFRIRTSKGNFRMLLVISNAIEFEGKDAVMISGMDMTEHNEMEEQLRQSEFNFRRLFENMQDVYYRTDVDGIVQKVSPAVTKILGYTPEEIEGKPAAELYPQMGDREAFRKEIMLHGMVSDFPGQMVTKDGRIIDISVNSQALYDDEGNYAGAEGICRDVTQRKLLEREMQRLATTDSLTGIANRRAFLEHAEHIFKSCQRYQTQMTLMMLDLDFFKGINDKYGHQSGDLALINFAEAVKLELRESDLFGRLGGEEFCVLLQQANQPEALLVAERIRAHVQSLLLNSAAGEPFSLTVSIGIAIYRAEDDRLGRLLERADKALYQAKSNGRNRVTWET
ncbi:sensor domain-containing diguanylate cyclase [Undibacterium sp. TC4M20W]|uniref:sensor domain-containing diguanylate cyclase n=1 Tax=Undibacterium sp. TC4M20W TaxID=3413052 RepID=UPI003BEFA0CC